VTLLKTLWSALIASKRNERIGLSGIPPQKRHGGAQTLPAADVVDAYWIRYQNRTFLNKGSGPMGFMLQDMAGNVKTGDDNWLKWLKR